MTELTHFGFLVALVASAALAAVLSNRISTWSRIPAPALFLLAAAAASELFPSLGRLSIQSVRHLVTIALVVVLFDGGIHIGWRRLRPAVGAVLWIGVVGTLLTAAAMALLAHLVFGLGWQIALLLGTALAPTDPAVVFSVLGRREITGRSGVILEGESGANDPVGIAMMVSLLAVTGSGSWSAPGTGSAGWSALGAGLGTFALQMAVGAAVGLLGGAGLLVIMRKVSLPSAALYPLRVLFGAAAIFGLATVLDGSGFLAVFLAGIVIGDANAPFRNEVVGFHGALASLGEIVAFVVLGLTVPLRGLWQNDAWLIGLALAVLLAVVVRPLLVGLMLLGVQLRAGERIFVAWAGLKGAVPILLGTFILTADLPGVARVYDIVFVVVAFSVVVQGGLVPAVARWTGVPMRESALTPWALGMRFEHEPQGTHRYTVAGGSPADGRRISDLSLGEDVWVSFVSRGGMLVPATGDTTLRPGDEVLLQVDPHAGPDPASLFEAPG